MGETTSRNCAHFSRFSSECESRSITVPRNTRRSDVETPAPPKFDKEKAKYIFGKIKKGAEPERPGTDRPSAQSDDDAHIDTSEDTITIENVIRSMIADPEVMEYMEYLGLPTKLSSETQCDKAREQLALMFEKQKNGEINQEEFITVMEQEAWV